MELPLGPSTQYVVRGGVELRVQTTEIVVYGCSSEHSYPLAFLFHQLKPLCLDDHTKALYKEYATKDDQQQFLMDNQAHTPMIPPIVSEPVSPMNTCAG